MARRGENIYKRKDGRYEGRYVVGKKANGQTKFGYVFARQYAEGCTREQEMADVTHPFPHPPGRPVLVWCCGKEWPQSVRG